MPHRKGWGAEPALGELVWGSKASARPELRRGAVRAESLRGTGRGCSPADPQQQAGLEALQATATAR